MFEIWRISLYVFLNLKVEPTFYEHTLEWNLFLQNHEIEEPNGMIFRLIEMHTKLK